MKALVLIIVPFVFPALQPALADQDTPPIITEMHVYDEPRAWELADAIRINDRRRVELLVKQGISAQLTPTQRRGYVQGAPPLCVAAIHGRAEIAEFLIANGANPNSFMPSGESALHIAVHGNHYETVKVLLDSGSDPNNAGGGEKTPLDVVDYRIARYQMIADLLIKHEGKRYSRDNNQGKEGQ